MIFTPHILQRRVLDEPQRDEYNRVIPDTAERWVDVCRCRCDDNDTMLFKSDNGSTYTPRYHIVCEGQQSIPAGEYIRCICEDGCIRGEGEVYRSKRLNCMPYSEVWI